MAFGGSGTDKRAARGAKLRATLLFAAAAEESTHLFAKSIEFPAQTRREVQ